MCASRETRSLTRHSLRAWSLCTRDVLQRQAKLEAYVEAKRNGTRHVDVLLRRREQCLRELRGSSSFSKDTERDEERVAKTIEYGSMIQLANGSSNFEEMMEFYPADCDFAKKKTGLEKTEHECTVAAKQADEIPNAKNTFFVRKRANRKDSSNSRDSSDEAVVKYGDRIILSANPMLFEKVQNDEEEEETPPTYSIKDLVCSTVSKEYNEYLYGGRKNAARNTFTVFRESNLARENEFEIVPWQSVGNNKSTSSAFTMGEEQHPPVKTNDAFLLKHCGRGGYLRCLNHENWSTPDFGFVKPVVSDENEALLSKRRFDTSYLWRFRVV